MDLELRSVDADAFGNVPEVPAEPDAGMVNFDADLSADLPDAVAIAQDESGEDEGPILAMTSNLLSLFVSTLCGKLEPEIDKDSVIANVVSKICDLCSCDKPMTVAACSESLVQAIDNAIAEVVAEAAAKDAAEDAAEAKDAAEEDAAAAEAGAGNSTVASISPQGASDILPSEPEYMIESTKSEVEDLGLSPKTDRRIRPVIDEQIAAPTLCSETTKLLEVIVPGNKIKVAGTKNKDMVMLEGADDAESVAESINVVIGSKSWLGNHGYTIIQGYDVANAVNIGGRKYLLFSTPEDIEHA